MERTSTQRQPKPMKHTDSSHSPDKIPPRKPTGRRTARYWFFGTLGLVAILVIAAVAARDRWIPPINQLISGPKQADAKKSDPHAGHDHAAPKKSDPHAGHDHAAPKKSDPHAGHDHAAPKKSDPHAGHDHAAPKKSDSHAGHDRAAPAPKPSETTSLKLSKQGRKNVGLTLVTIAFSDFERTISIPATLVDRPGRTEIAISAPMTGIVTQVYPIRGSAVTPGDKLFDLRLTHADLVEKQANLLRAYKELDVIHREITRLEKLTATGAVAGKLLLERQYEEDKVEAALISDKQALLLHGLSKDQVEAIDKDRLLMQTMTVEVPQEAVCRLPAEHEEFLQVVDLAVKSGEHVQTGTPLATLSDRCELFVEGKAFSQDAEALNRAANDGLELTASIDTGSPEKQEVAGLKILYIEDEVDRISRALKFYVRLPNELVRNETTSTGHRFIGWRYKPGQPAELFVPIERWENRIVLPIEAIIQEGPETYVYRQISGLFVRTPVHVEYRDSRLAVIENDGSLSVGDAIAKGGAYQIHLAVKNKSGGGADPHAGHHH